MLPGVSAHSMPRCMGPDKVWLVGLQPTVIASRAPHVLHLLLEQSVVDVHRPSKSGKQQCNMHRVVHARRPSSDSKFLKPLTVDLPPRSILSDVVRPSLAIRSLTDDIRLPFEAYASLQAKTVDGYHPSSILAGHSDRTARSLVHVASVRAGAVRGKSNISLV